MNTQKSPGSVLSYEEKRRSQRLRLSIPLWLKQNTHTVLQDVRSYDLNPFGVQIESSYPLEPKTLVELLPREGNGRNDFAVRGEIRWARPVGEKYRGGIVFENMADWAVPLSGILKALPGLETGTSLFFQNFLESLDDGILVLGPDLTILGSNTKQPFCLPRDPERLKGENLRKVSFLLRMRAEDRLFEDILQRVIATGEGCRLSAFPYSAPGTPDPNAPSYFHIWICPLLEQQGSQLLVLRSRDVTALKNLQELERERQEDFWLQYRHVTLGQLFDSLLDDIINPLSAVVGRLDLLALKMAERKGTPGHAGAETWISDLETVQGLLGYMAEFCRAAARRREPEVPGLPPSVSLNALIQKELDTLDLHSNFKKISKSVTLAPDLPSVHGSYSDWANAFVMLCQVIARQMATMERREITFHTTVEDERVVLRIGHNGKALPMPLCSDTRLTILRLLRNKYGVTICVSGNSGAQTVALKTPSASEARACPAP